MALMVGERLANPWKTCCGCGRWVIVTERRLGCRQWRRSPGHGSTGQGRQTGEPPPRPPFSSPLSIIRVIQGFCRGLAALAATSTDSPQNETHLCQLETRDLSHVPGSCGNDLAEKLFRATTAHTDHVVVCLAATLAQFIATQTFLPFSLVQ